MATRTVHKKSTRIWAGLTAALLLALLLFSAAFLIARADHDCTGEDCGVCAQLEAVVSGFACAGGAAAAAICAVRLLWPRTKRVDAPKGAVCAFTPMGSRVRLNI